MNCGKCLQQFEVVDADLELLKKLAPVVGGQRFELPEPVDCPECRLKQRMRFRNESSLYKRKCDFTGVDMITMYREDCGFPVYSPDIWFGDQWDAREYGRDFDFSRGFFEQFAELKCVVPRLALVSSNNQNCDFCNIVGDSKDSYLIYGSILCEDCYYGTPFNCKHCIDSLVLRSSELCYECSDSEKLYECFYCANCSNSRGLWFCDSVQNCQDCFGCVNLNHKRYCVFNEQKTKEEFEDAVRNFSVEEVRARVAELKAGLPQRYYIGTNNENVVGNYVFNSKDCYNVFGVSECRDVRHSMQVLKGEDVMDCCYNEVGELCYQLMGSYGASRAVCCVYVWDGADSLTYCLECNKNVRDCFGCIGLKHAQYCILNKQCSREEYEELVPKIVEHMRASGEWGQFFPESLSAFNYDETVAADFYPRGEIENAPFKVIPQEKAFLGKYGLKEPALGPRARHRVRVAHRNTMRLYDGRCGKCGVAFEATFDPEGGVKVYCEKCYREEVF